MQKYQLLIVAHPDDETIFFGGLILQERRWPWHVIVLTDGNADKNGRKRTKDLQKAAKILGIQKLEQWNYPDVYEKRLPVEDIAQRLREYKKAKRIFTHGPIGEYGHPHHQDTCAAVHLAFPEKKVFSVAYNCKADFTVTLKPSSFARKSEIFAHTYFSETKNFIETLPASPSENFTALSPKEVKSLYSFFTKGKKPLQLKHYLWFKPFLSRYKIRASKRPF